MQSGGVGGARRQRRAHTVGRCEREAQSQRGRAQRQPAPAPSRHEQFDREDLRGIGRGVRQFSLLIARPSRARLLDDCVRVLSGERYCRPLSETSMPPRAPVVVASSSEASKGTLVERSRNSKSSDLRCGKAGRGLPSEVGRHGRRRGSGPTEMGRHIATRMHSLEDQAAIRLGSCWVGLPEKRI